ncbi:MAG: hypothetical protein QOI66_4414 [Myxococcales bacterium]|jgi:hypothetical protein|nr:hypothetical protein [Myxococcales bacterium]
MAEAPSAPSVPSTPALPELLKQGARAEAWSPGADVVRHDGIRCQVDDGVALFRGASGVRWNKPVHVNGAFALRLVAFEEIAQDEAQAILGTRIASIEHLGAYACRPIKGTAGSPSEHATGNAIDVAAFVLRDKRRIAVQRDFVAAGAEPTTPGGRFLRALTERLSAQRVFGTVLTPDYDRNHRNHFHLDGHRWFWDWPGAAS